MSKSPKFGEPFRWSDELMFTERIKIPTQDIQILIGDIDGIKVYRIMRDTDVQLSPHQMKILALPTDWLNAGEALFKLTCMGIDTSGLAL